MAEIRIEKKKSGGILPWILGLLLLGLLIWGAAELFEESDELEAVSTEEVDEDYRPAAEVSTDIEDVDYAYRNAFQAYMDFTEDMTGEMGLDHEFSHDALTMLADATIAVGDSRNVDLSGKMDRVHQLADDITKDPMATDHADKIRMAAMNIVESLEKVDMDAYESGAKNEISMLRKEAQAITGKALALNQKEDVRTFFGAARNVLAKMM